MYRWIKLLWAVAPVVVILFSLIFTVAPAHAAQSSHQVPAYPICNGDACDFVYPAPGHYNNYPYTDCQDPTRITSVAMVDDKGVTDGHLYLYNDTYTGTGMCEKDVWGTVSLVNNFVWPSTNLAVYTTRTNTTDDALDQVTYYAENNGPGNYMDAQLAGYDTESVKDCFNAAVDWTAPDGHAEHTQTPHNGFCP